MLKWVTMQNARTERELRRLNIDTNQAQLPAAEGGRQLRSRTVANKPPPPVPPPRASSAPAPKVREGFAREPTPFPGGETSNIDTTDVESIDHRLGFAHQQLMERHRLNEPVQSSSPDSVSATLRPEESQKDVTDTHAHNSPSSEGDYMTPDRHVQPSLGDAQNPPMPHFLPPPGAERPDVFLGEIDFDPRTKNYKFRHSSEMIGPEVAIYVEPEDKCYYYSTEGKFKSVLRDDLPDHTSYALLRSGPLISPNWGTMCASLMTPQPKMQPPPVSFPPSAFRPVNLPMPTPTHPTLQYDTQPYPTNMQTFAPLPETMPMYPQTPPNVNYANFMQQRQQELMDRQFAQQLQDLEIQNQPQMQGHSAAAPVVAPPNPRTAAPVVVPSPNQNQPLGDMSMHLPPQQNRNPRRSFEMHAPPAQNDAYNRIIDEANRFHGGRHNKSTPFRQRQTHFNTRQQKPQVSPKPVWSVPKHKHFTSTPRYQNNSFRGDPNETSILQVLESQRRCQENTTQALERIVDIHSSRANDMFLADVPMFSGEPAQLNDWLLKVEKVAKLTGRSERTIASAKSDGTVFRVLRDAEPHISWERCKNLLRECFSDCPTKVHAAVKLTRQNQQPDESLRDFIYRYSDMVKVLEKKDPWQITDSVKIVLFAKHLFNFKIRKSVIQKEHKSLQEAFNFALKAESKAKQFEGLSDNDPTVSKLETTPQVNMIQTTEPSQQTKPPAATNAIHTNFNQRPSAVECHKCGEPGHISRNCPLVLQALQCYKCNETGHISRNCPLIVQQQQQQSACFKCGGLDHFARECPQATHMQTPQYNVGTPSLFPTTIAPKLTQTITAEQRIPTSMWQNFVAEFEKTKQENKEMKRYFRKQQQPQAVKPKRQQKPTAYTAPQTRAKQPQQMRVTKPQTATKPKTKAQVKHLMVDTMEDQDDDDIIPQCLQDSFDEDDSDSVLTSSDDEPEIHAQVNVILGDAGLASEFILVINEKKEIFLYDTGASHSLMNLEWFYTMFPNQKLDTSKVVSITAASGTKMRPSGTFTTTFQLGSKSFTQEFIVCSNLTSNIIVGLDFQKNNRIGTDWTPNGTLYLHQGKQFLLEANKKGENQKTTRLVSKSQIFLPPGSFALVQCEVKGAKVIRPQECLLSDADPNFVAQYPDIAAIPLAHCPDEKNPQDLSVCLVNPNTWEVVIPKNKTIHELQPVSGKVSVNKIAVENIMTPDVVTPKKPQLIPKVTPSNLVMPGDYSPHQRVGLEDYPIQPSTKKAFKKLTKQFDCIVSKNSNDISTTPLLKMDIQTEGPPVASRPYVLPLKHHDFVRKTIEELEIGGVIRKSLSPYASPIVVVPRKAPPGSTESEQKRLCIDYRCLNQQIPFVQKANSNAKGVISLIPLPKIDELLGKLKGSKVFSTIDLRQGYHHIGLTEESIPKTAFTTPFGKWEFVKVPFGLTQAPAYFMALINQVLEGCHAFAIVYMDDILVFSDNEESHLLHLAEIFKRLKKARLKIKLSKCSFFKKHLHYLGHIISPEGIMPMEDKLAAIKDLAPPTTAHEVQQAMGLFGYYRKFVPNFAEIAKVIVNLTRNNVPFEWTPQCQSAFDTLKEYLVKSPILVYPDPEKEYHLFTDASKTSWSAILMQENSETKHLHPIAFQSGSFKGSQLNWAALTKEAYAIYMGFRKLSYYLEGAQTILWCDHAPLKKFLAGRTLNNKVNNWGIELSSFHIEFNHIKGKKNVMADALSRLKRLGLYEEVEPEQDDKEFGHTILEELPEVQVNHTHATPPIPAGVGTSVTHSVAALESTAAPQADKLQTPVTLPQTDDLDLLSIATQQAEDPFCKEVLEKLHLPKFSSFKVANNILYRNTKIKTQVFDAVVVPADLQQKILHMAHENLGHMGRNKTYAFLRQRYFWPNLKQDVSQHVQTCELCIPENLRPVRYVPGTLSIPEAPMYHLYVDLIGPFPTTERGNTYCLTACCALTDFLFCVPIPNKEAETVIQAYLKNIYATHGGSKVLISDNGTEWKNSLFKRVTEELGMTQHFISAYLPSANLVERHHSSLKRCIKKFCRRDATRWDTVVPFACLTQNLFPHTVEGESALFKMFGRDPVVLGLEKLLQPKRRYLGTSDTLLDLEAMHTCHMETVMSLKAARQKPDRVYADKVLPKVGDAVLFKNHSKSSFDSNFVPGYRVIQKIDDNTYVIKHSISGKQSQVHLRDLVISPIAHQVLDTLPPIETFGRVGKFANCPQLALKSDK